MLGYCIERGQIKPDPDRLKPLREIPIPSDKKSLKRAMGLFSYYSQLIPKFSEMIHPLASSIEFPIPARLISIFNHLKELIANSMIGTVEEDVPLVVETDASEHAIAASLNQSGRPVAFFSRSLSRSEQGWHSVEKEACAIVESLQKCRHYLLGKPFQVVTDQKALSFMYDTKKHGKVKNEKIARWRVELSAFKYDIIHRPGKANHVADTLTRTDAKCASAFANNPSSARLSEIHNLLCHPGVARLAHFVRSQNLP